MMTVTKDRVAELVKSIEDLANKRVMVGVPADSPQGAGVGPKQRRQGPATNALLAYVHNYGSPARNIPARPFLEPGVAAALPKAESYLRAAAVAAADGKMGLVDRHLHAVGLIVQSAIRLKITTGPFAPLAPSTVAARMAKVRAVGGQVAAGFAAITPLVDTGQLRAAIAYVIRKVRK